MTFPDSRQVPCIFLGTYLGKPIQATSECAATRDEGGDWYIDDYWWTEGSGTMDYNRASFFRLDQTPFKGDEAGDVCITSITPLDPTIRPLILDEELDDGPQPCEDCGSKQAEHQPCPYASDIHHDDALHWLCADCARQRAQDI